MLDLSLGVSRQRANVPKGFTMKHAALLAVLTFASSLNAASMSHEEAVVRQTYAKLAYAADVANLHHLLDSYAQKNIDAKQVNTGEAMHQLDKQKIQFQLYDFKVGNVADMKGNYEEYVTKPHGEMILVVNTNTLRYSEDNTHVDGSTAEAQWVQAPILTEDWKTPVSKVLAQMPDNITFLTYASYRVTVKFQNDSRDYKALALFVPGKPGIVEFIDTVTGNHALDFFCKADVSPKTLSETSLHDNPIVAEWLKSNQPPQ